MDDKKLVNVEVKIKSLYEIEGVWHLLEATKKKVTLLEQIKRKILYEKEEVWRIKVDQCCLNLEMRRQNSSSNMHNLEGLTIQFGQFREHMALKKKLDNLFHIVSQNSESPLQGKHLVVEAFMESPRQIYHFYVYYGG